MEILMEMNILTKKLRVKLWKSLGSARTESVLFKCSCVRTFRCVPLSSFQYCFYNIFNLHKRMINEAWHLNTPLAALYSPFSLPLSPLYSPSSKSRLYQRVMKPVFAPALISFRIIHTRVQVSLVSDTTQNSKISKTRKTCENAKYNRTRRMNGCSACSATDRHVSVFPASELSTSHHYGKHHAWDQLHVHGLQQRTAADVLHDDRPRLLACPQSTGGPTVCVLMS